MLHTASSATLLTKLCAVLYVYWAECCAVYYATCCAAHYTTFYTKYCTVCWPWRVIFLFYQTICWPCRDFIWHVATVMSLLPRLLWRRRYVAVVSASTSNRKKEKTQAVKKKKEESRWFWSKMIDSTKIQRWSKNASHRNSMKRKRWKRVKLRTRPPPIVVFVHQNRKDFRRMVRTLLTSP